MLFLNILLLIRSVNHDISRINDLYQVRKNKRSHHRLIARTIINYISIVNEQEKKQFQNYIKEEEGNL